MNRWRNLAVAIASHTAGGGQKLGSGMLISDDLVLTANHVVNQTGANGPVRLRWKFDSEGSYNLSEYENAVEQIEGDRGIIWYHEEADIALIKCRKQENFEAVYLARTEPVDGLEWYAETFPVIGNSNTQSNKAPENCYLSGTASSAEALDQNSRFSLLGDARIRVSFADKPNDTEQQHLSDWGGVSGASVVVNAGHNQFAIVGVIVTEDNRLSNSLDAVPIVEALKLKDCRSGKTFAQLVYPRGILGHTQCMVLLQKSLENFLELSNGEFLLRKFISPLLEPDVDIINCRVVADKISTLSVSDAIDAVADIFEGCDNDKKVKDCARKLACAIASVTAGRLLCPQISVGLDPLLPMDCGSLTGVEIGMASVDGRIAEFHGRVAEGDLPRGLNYLELPPEQGSKVRKSLAGESISAQIGGDILTLVGKSAKTPAPTAFLKTQKRRGKPSYYLAPAVSEGDQESLAQWEQTALAMKQEGVEHVYIVPYDPDKVEKDEEFFGVLRGMLPLSSE